MAHFYVGCAVWANKDWLGELFPHGSWYNHVYHFFAVMRHISKEWHFCCL
jgi:hypothetical protein